MSMRRASRSGFTLVELLVATGVFMIGFSAAFGLFLAAIRYRTLADDTTRLSLAASSIVEELAIGNGSTQVVGSKTPDLYQGSGDLLGQTDTTKFYPYAGVPGTWFTVEKCTDVTGGNDAHTPTLHLTLLVLVFTQADSSLDLEDVNRRVRILTPANGFRGTLSNDEPQQIRDGLVKRGLAMRISAVVLRRPAWM